MLNHTNCLVIVQYLPMETKTAILMHLLNDIVEKIMQFIYTIQIIDTVVMLQQFELMLLIYLMAIWNLHEYLLDTNSPKKKFEVNRLHLSRNIHLLTFILLVYISQKVFE